MKRLFLGLVGIMGLSACTGTDTANPAPADPAVLGSLSTAQETQLLQLLKPVALSSSPRLGDLPVSGKKMVTLLPPPPGSLEGNSPALPEIFDLFLEDGQCRAVSRQSGKSALLAELPCERAGS